MNRGATTGAKFRFALLSLLGGAILVWLAWHSRADLLRVLRNVSLEWVAASVAAGLALNIVYGLLFDHILCKYTRQARPLMHAAVYLMSQPGKYLPGKLWQAVMQSVALGRRTGMTSVGIANVELSLAAVTQATGLGAMFLLGVLSAPAQLVLVITLTICHLLVAKPSAKLLFAAFPRLRDRLRPDGDDSPPKPPRSTSILLLNLAAMAANAAASWFLLIAAHTSLSTLQMQHLLASLWLGIAASLLAMPVPAGLGVREAAMAGFGVALAPDVPPALLISIALLARCWQLLVDVASVCAGWAMWRIARRNAGP